jgi:UDP-N-acetylmuramoyl-tripeptide--D-alanyl-D-alanine ligase
MESRPLQYIVERTGGERVLGDPTMVVAGVSTDSRAIGQGDLFVALRGDRFDGHDFLLEAIRAGAAALLIDRAGASRAPAHFPQLWVDDTRQALGRLAAAYRREFDLPVVGVAGSNGKTTTKDLLASVLSRCRQLVASEASFNNDIGVPKTLLRLDRHCQAAVVELGTNHPGELLPLARMAQPTHGIITSIGHEHLEFFGNLEAIIREEAALAECLPSGGTLWLNGDSPGADAIVSRTTARVVRVGRGSDCDWRAADIRVDCGGTTFEAVGPERRLCGQYRLRLLGRHQAYNALLALAAAAELGCDRETIAAGLSSCPTPNMRLQLHELNGALILEDAYNANGDSMRAALDTLRDMPGEGSRVAVLGDMAELGSESERTHFEVGRYAGELGVQALLAVGTRREALAAGARAGGVRQIRLAQDIEEAALTLQTLLKPGDVALIKASRCMRFERISAALRAATTGVQA